MVEYVFLVYEEL